MKSVLRVAIVINARGSVYQSGSTLYFNAGRMIK
jgi:hypothetical protein